MYTETIRLFASTNLSAPESQIRIIDYEHDNIGQLGGRPGRGGEDSGERDERREQEEVVLTWLCPAHTLSRTWASDSRARSRAH